MSVPSKSDREKKSEMTLPTRKFGIEIEFIGCSKVRAAQALQGAGVSCHVEAYGHRTPSAWKIVDDGSVRSRNGTPGAELVSPPLSGEEGLEQVRTALRALVLAGATVNTSCGLHVHVDAADFTGADFARIFQNYRTHTPVINQMMPRSRVGNTYCKSLDMVYDWSSFLTRLQMAPASNILNEAHRFDRYHTVNLASFARHGTLEFRQHSGTVNATKATNWIQFVLYFVQNAKNQNSTASAVSVPGTSAPVAGRRRRGRQTNYAARRALWTLMSQCSARTVTIQDLATASGYTASTVNVLLSGLRNNRQAGGAIMQIRTATNYLSPWGAGRAARRKIRSVIVTRPDALDVWLGNAAGATVAASPTSPARVVNSDSVAAPLWEGMPIELRGYYSERAADFGHEWQ